MDRDFEYEEWLDSQQDEYFNRCHDVQCQACKYQEAATEAILRQAGWHLSRNGEFCPSHADYPAHQQLVEWSRSMRRSKKDFSGVEFQRDQVLGAAIESNTVDDMMARLKKAGWSVRSAA